MNSVEWLRRGIALEGVTVAYNALEGIVAIVAFDSQSLSTVLAGEVPNAVVNAVS